MVGLRKHVDHPTAELAAWRRARLAYLGEWDNTGSAIEGGHLPCDADNCQSCRGLEIARNEHDTRLRAILARPVSHAHDVLELLEVMLAENHWNRGEMNDDEIEANPTFNALVEGIKDLAAREADRARGLQWT